MFGRDMARPRIDKEKAARALAQWAMYHCREAYIPFISDSFKVDERTLWRWKKALETDKELSLLYEQRLNDLYSQDWLATLDRGIGAYLARLLELAPTADIEQSRETFKVLSEIKITKEVLAPNAANRQPNTNVSAEIGAAEARETN